MSISYAQRAAMHYIRQAAVRGWYSATGAQAVASEDFEFNASHIDDHGLCPVCAEPVRKYDDGFTRTHTCDACGYHDVDFNWISD